MKQTQSAGTRGLRRGTFSYGTVKKVFATDTAVRCFRVHLPRDEQASLINREHSEFFFFNANIKKTRK